MDVQVLPSAANTELGSRWQLERRLAGGWNEGAYLVSRPDGSRAVLKGGTSQPERLLGARARVEAPVPEAGLRLPGWPQAPDDLLPSDFPPMSQTAGLSGLRSQRLGLETGRG